MPSSATLLQAKMNAYQSPSRTPTLRRVISIRPKDITNAANGVNEVLVGIHFAAHPMHEDIDDVRLWIKAVIKNVLENHGFGHHAVGIAHQVFEQGEFA